ncbi:hypothetical protein KAR91_36500 [Candidatus Pacearchaeota archaeon]|nr:hypothetical protein [Candidatus Pacearchaeota archaeon]
MRVCTYIVVHDTGLAPNPFWGWCTLALCTPNHMGIKLEKGDWIVGFLSKARNNNLLYAMELYEILDFNDYYNTKRFSKKIPNIEGSWKERCGDNIYFKNNYGKWTQAKTIYHRGMLKKDTKHPRVFIAKNYYYFGDKSVAIPPCYHSLVPNRQGVKCKHNQELVKAFFQWIDKNYHKWILGNPIDNKDRIKANKAFHIDHKATRQPCGK